MKLVERKHKKVKRVDGNGVVKSGWGMMWFCSSVRSTPFTVPNPQENKNKEENELRSFLCGDQGGNPREQNRELTTT